MNKTMLEDLVEELLKISCSRACGGITSDEFKDRAKASIYRINNLLAERERIADVRLREIVEDMDHTVKNHVYPGQDASIEGVVKQYADRIRTEVLGEPDQRLSAFLAEYEALCRKHMLVIDGVYHGTVVVWDLGKADVDALLTLIRDQIMEHGIKMSEEEEFD